MVYCAARLLKRRLRYGHIGLSSASVFSLVCCLAALFLLPALSARAQTTGSQAPEPFYKVGVFISSENDGCFIPGDVRAIRQFTTKRMIEINAAGGVNGRKLRLEFMDEFDDVDNIKRLVEQAISDPSMIAMVGLNSSTRGVQVVERIGQSGIPLISEISRNDLFAPYDNIFALTSAVEDELDVVRKFVENSNFAAPAFIGQKGNLYIESINQALADRAGAKPVDQTHWLSIDTSDYSIANINDADRIIDDLISQKADFLFLAIHSTPGVEFLKRLRQRDISMPVFILLGNLGRMQQLMKDDPYPSDMYIRTRGNAPFVLNERLSQRIWKAVAQNWIFQSMRASENKSTCKEREKPKPITDVNDSRNHRAINFGVRYRDMLSLIAETANAPGEAQEVVSIRKRIKNGLHDLRQGRKIFRGWWHDWAFTRHRAVAENSFIVRLDPRVGEMELAPTQYQLTPLGLEQVPVVYISIDMIRLFAVNSNENSFQTEFYLSFRSNGDIDINDIEFTNALRAQFSKETLINIRQIHARDGARFLPADLNLYKISGKFMFDPDLSRYPFDKQRFSISFQPSNAARPFIIQPPPITLANQSFEIDGWRPDTQYVGSDQDIIAVLGDHVSEQNIIPLYKFNFTWTMTRITTDYYLRVLVPLIVILITTYLSVFIPANRLESVVAIQVTALLSSIALYLSIQKLNFEHATISDQIFVITYVAITLMLACSVVRVQLVTRDYWRANAGVKTLQIVLLPLFIVVMVAIVFASESLIDPIRRLFSAVWN
ncbi:MAG: ABC transporter substrate-binding protein [Rhizobiaceae bacterium]